jgi:hypothetical protein
MRRHVRRILTPSERQMLKAKVGELTAQMDTPTVIMGPNGPVWVPDHSNLERPHQVQAELQKTKRVLEEGTPQDMTRREVVAREKDIRILEERVKKRMVPEKQFKMASDDSSDYRKVVDELVRQGQDPVLSADIQALKNLRRERDPDNPSAGGIEDLRRE